MPHRLDGVGSAVTRGGVVAADRDTDAVPDRGLSLKDPGSDGPDARRKPVSGPCSTDTVITVNGDLFLTVLVIGHDGHCPQVFEPGVSSNRIPPGTRAGGLGQVKNLVDGEVPPRRGQQGPVQGSAPAYL